MTKITQRGKVIHCDKKVNWFLYANQYRLWKQCRRARDINSLSNRLEHVKIYFFFPFEPLKGKREEPKSRNVPRDRAREEFEEILC